MKTQTALAIGAGYILGRTKKMKLALTLAGVGAGKLASSNGDGLLQAGSELLRSSPAFNDLISDVRGQLFEASKQAAASAARSQIDSMSERLLQSTAGGRDGASEDSDDTEDSGDNRQASSSKSAASKKPAKKQSASKRSASKQGGQSQSAKRRPANKRPANKQGSGRSGSQSRSQQRSRSGSARRS